MIRLRRIVWFTVFLPIACSNKLPPAGIQAFQQCDYQKAIEIFDKSKKKKKDALLYDLATLSSAVYQGDAETIKSAGLRAQQQMWGYDGQGAGTASLISSEAIRVYKGEPFEKTMVGIYLGITYFNEQEYDNARAAFTKAMFAVETKNEDIPPDFAAPYVLLTKTYLQLGDGDNARIVLNRLEKALPQYKLKIEDLENIRTMVLVESGWGPQKIRTGPGASLIGWQRQSYRRREAYLEIDGKPLEIVFETDDDLTYQASTIDRGSKTAIQATKGGLREAATATAIIAGAHAANQRNATAGWVALGAGLFALANQSQADIRQWELLPDLLSLKLSPEPLSEGQHEFSASFSQRIHDRLPSPSQVWYDERKLGHDKIYIVRAKSCRSAH